MCNATDFSGWNFFVHPPSAHGVRRAPDSIEEVQLLRVPPFSLASSSEGGFSFVVLDAIKLQFAFQCFLADVTDGFGSFNTFWEVGHFSASFTLIGDMALAVPAPILVLQLIPWACGVVQAACCCWRPKAIPSTDTFEVSPKGVLAVSLEGVLRCGCVRLQCQ